LDSNKNVDLICSIVTCQSQLYTSLIRSVSVENVQQRQTECGRNVQGERNNDGLHFSLSLISDVVNSRWSLLDVRISTNADPSYSN